MSHYIDILTQIYDRTALVRALERVGFKNKIEVYDKAQNLHGYQGDTRKQVAHVIIRRQHVGSSANDIGFEKTKDGPFKAHISEFDSGSGSYSSKRALYGKDWQNKLYTYYGVEKAKMEFDKKGMAWEEDVDEKERPRLRVNL